MELDNDSTATYALIYCFSCVPLYIIRINETTDFEEQTFMLADKISKVMHDESTQTLNSFSIRENEQHMIDNNHDDDIDQLEGSNSLFKVINNYNN